MMTQESAMTQRVSKPENESATHRVGPMDDAGAATLICETICENYNEAFDRLFEIKDGPHSRFEISRGGASISPGPRCK
jgi:hypothetical protein